ncbi:glycogen synthase GlgA [Devosia ginsengisoli]|uniref:Glycogen synthase n=1 Tax=Devosia ginsengisoli TaxID=400770 RepID=A0A5B8LXM1_9HYPH|nr:glycogen synthase GlgA [Devosia ginsengisoli]QDZ13248.1 glycogen synthase GlgA [Devosia ginsengisoli]
MEVLSVASEVYPLIKTGGLADVAGALPGALAGRGVTMRTLVPGYPAVMSKLSGGRVVRELDDLFGVPAKLIAARVEGLDVIVIDAPALYDRPGNPYVSPDGWDWPDNWKRFAALGWVAAELAHGLVAGYRPNLLHCHDWQAGLAPAYIKFGPTDDVKTVMTIHNIAFKGSFGPEIFGQLRLPPHAFEMGGVEFYGGVSYLKSGMECADYVTTVSPNYADEIRTPEFGMGLEGLLNGRAETVVGILNGIDVDAWNPATDRALVQTYSANTIHARQVNKRAVVEKFGLDGADGPLFCVISRLTDQKGMDLLLQTVDGLVDLGGRLAVLGSGDAALEDGFRTMWARHPGKVSIVTGYNEQLSHLMQGGCDAILIPSRFEPCGLTQLYGLRYGCVPVVSRIGGLADTVIDANPAALAAEVATGVVFDAGSAHALYEAIRRTTRLYHDDKVWKKIQRRGMKSDVSWDTSAVRYAELYAIITGLMTNDDPDH